MSTLLAAFVMPALLPLSHADVCEGGLARAPLTSVQHDLLRRAADSGRTLRILRDRAEGARRIVVLLGQAPSPQDTRDELEYQKAFSKHARMGPTSFAGYWFADSVREMSQFADEAAPVEIAAEAPEASSVPSIDLLEGFTPSIYNRLHAAAWVGARRFWFTNDSLVYAYAVSAILGVFLPAPVSNLANTALYGVTSLQSISSYGWTYGYSRGVLAIGRRARHMAKTLLTALDAEPSEVFAVLDERYLKTVAKILRRRGFADVTADVLSE